MSTSLEDIVDNTDFSNSEIVEQSDEATWSWLDQAGAKNSLEAVGTNSVSLLISIKMFAGREGSFFYNPSLSDALAYAKNDKIEIRSCGVEAIKIWDAIQDCL